MQWNEGFEVYGVARRQQSDDVEPHLDKYFRKLQFSQPVGYFICCAF